MRRTTSFTIICQGTGASKTFRTLNDNVIETKELFPMYYARLRSLGYRRDQLINQSAEHLFDMYERHKEWIRKGIVSSQLKLLMS